MPGDNAGLYIPWNAEPGQYVEWGVAGDPGHGYPYYTFVWRGPDAEAQARRFAQNSGLDWDTGPELFSRVITVENWKRMEFSQT